MPGASRLLPLHGSGRHERKLPIPGRSVSIFNKCVQVDDMYNQGSTLTVDRQPQASKNGFGPVKTDLNWSYLASKLSGTFLLVIFSPTLGPSNA